MMPRILILGSPGSGKSTLRKEYELKLGLQGIEIDAMSVPKPKPGHPSGRVFPLEILNIIQQNTDTGTVWSGVVDNWRRMAKHPYFTEVHFIVGDPARIAKDAIKRDKYEGRKNLDYVHSKYEEWADGWNKIAEDMHKIDPKRYKIKRRTKIG